MPKRGAKGGDGIVVVSPIQPQEGVLSALLSLGRSQAADEVGPVCPVSRAWPSLMKEGSYLLLPKLLISPQSAQPSWKGLECSQTPMPPSSVRV